MGIRATSRFTVEQASSESWLVHALVAEVVDRLREQPGVRSAFTVWPNPTAFVVHTHHQGDRFGAVDDLMVAFETTLVATLDGHAALEKSGTELLAS